MKLKMYIKINKLGLAALLTIALLYTMHEATIPELYVAALVLLTVVAHTIKILKKEY